MTETDIQNAIRLELSKYGVCFRMNTGVFKQGERTIKCGVKGMSDLLFIKDGRAYWLEVKTETGRPSAEQLNFLSVMRKHGCIAEIVRSVDDAVRAVGKTRGER